MKPGTILRFTRGLGGVCSVERGNRLRYLGNSYARILDGPSAGWVVVLTATSPVEIVNKEG